jgi:hypothetical protein
MSDSAKGARRRYSFVGILALAGRGSEGALVEHTPAYTLAEVIDLDLEARHVAEGGVVYTWKNGRVVRGDCTTGVSVLITKPENVPDWPWYAVKRS